MSAVEELKTKGNKAFADKKFTEAVKFYTDAIDMDESNYTLYSNRSGAYCAAGKYNLAEADARKVIQLKSDWVRGYTRLGAALTGQKKWTEAITTYERALELDPGNENIAEDLSEARSAASRESKSSSSGGDRRFDIGTIFSPERLARLRTNPKIASLFNDPSFVSQFNELTHNPTSAFSKYGQDPRFQLLFQTILSDLGSDLGVAPTSGSGGDEDETETPISPPPSSSSNSSSSSRSTGNDTSTTSSSGVKTGDSSGNVTDNVSEREKILGNEAFRAGRLEEALSHYDLAIESDPHNVTLRNNKAVVLSKQGRHQEAIDLVRAAIEDGRVHGASYEVIAKAYQKIAVAYVGLNDLDGAIDALTSSLLEKQDPTVKRELRLLQDKRAKQKAQEYENPELAEKARQEGNTAFKDGKFPDAVALYTEAIKRSPRNASLYSNRAAAYSKLGEFPMAIADCDKAIELDSNFAKAYTRKAYCHFMMKEYHKARECYNQALSIDANNAEALSGLDDITHALSQQRYKAPDEEQIRRAMADPEIQRIVQDPGMQQILKDMQENPSKASHYFSDPTIRNGLYKLRDAGILQF
jgi:stress-induced-phosphoprotein 1